MYRILVVDDEPYIVKRIAGLLDEQEHLELDVYKVYSAFEALELLKQVRMDIVLSDVRMPGMDGLQLLEEVRRIWPNCRVIMLTGYNEFDYIYTAIKLNCTTYLTKTEDDSELIRAIETTIDSINKSRVDEEFIQKAKNQISISLPLLQREYIYNLLNGDGELTEVNQEGLDELEISLKADLEVILLIGIFDESDKGLAGAKNTQMYLAVKAIAEHYFSDYLTFVNAVVDRTYMVWLLQPGKDGRGDTYLYVKENIEIIQKTCKEYLKTDISFIHDNRSAAWNEVQERYRAMKRMLNSRIGFIPGAIIIFKDTMDNGPENLLNSNYAGQNTDYLQNHIDMLETLLEQGHKDKFLYEINKALGPLKEVPNKNNPFALEIYHSVALILLSYINNNRLFEKIAFKIGLNRLMRTDEFDIWEEAVN
ncbi:MAG: response regulator, partial [Clostridiales bacterium]|nr:response regulator [Clostridiales bacterium]